MKDARKQERMCSGPVNRSNNFDRYDSYSANMTLEARIRARAYEIYEQCGRQDGFAECNWLQAEAEILAGDSLAIAA